MTAEEYDEHKGAELLKNPYLGELTMSGATKAELHEAIDEALEILNEADTPESSRECSASSGNGILRRSHSGENKWRNSAGTTVQKRRCPSSVDTC